jgi:hypothetical protein
MNQLTIESPSPVYSTIRRCIDGISYFMKVVTTAAAWIATKESPVINVSALVDVKSFKR